MQNTLSPPRTGDPEALAALADHPRATALRQVGTIAALDVGAAEGYLSGLAPRLLRFFAENDVLLRPLGNTVYVMPPYCIGDDELQRVYRVIARALDEI